MFDATPSEGALLGLDLQDRVQTVFLATWSNLGPSDTEGQKPLRTKSEPFGLNGLIPAALDTVGQAKKHCEG